MNDLVVLAQLINQRNETEREIARLTGRPAAIGHLGEYIASKIFGIQLVHSASNRAIDGHFTEGQLAGSSVNIKWYAKQEGLLDITPAALPDIYLVLTGPKSAAMSSRGTARPWLITQVYCFEAPILVSQLTLAGVKIGIATSVRQDYWASAEVYPISHYGKLILSEGQRQMLTLFS